MFQANEVQLLWAMPQVYVVMLILREQRYGNTVQIIIFTWIGWGLANKMQSCSVDCSKWLSCCCFGGVCFCFYQTSLYSLLFAHTITAHNTIQGYIRIHEGYAWRLLRVRGVGCGDVRYNYGNQHDTEWFYWINVFYSSLLLLIVSQLEMHLCLY
jgi:hypothetical protein